MPADKNRIDSIIQFALLVAGEEDEYFDRQLGPIHLIKYVYLADLAHAKRNDGKSYTGTKWQFYKFGPWSQTVNERVPIACTAIAADERRFESHYEDKDDWVRYCIRDDRLLEQKTHELPIVISMTLRRDVHKFLQDTPSLLDYVYKTGPIISAAPREYLDLTLAIENPQEKPSAEPLRVEQLSNKKRKKLGERIRGLRNDRAIVDRKIINPVTKARFDTVYEEGVAWLDDLAGEPLQTAEIKVEFSDEVWKSSARKGNDVS